WRLRLYRRRSRLLESRGGVALLLSEDITSPVTFGALHPVVLLPAGFPALNPRVREAILCHELLHVRRRDWIFTLGEELVRTVLWFHPAIWWLLGQIQLAREQAVDREVVETTRRREAAARSGTRAAVPAPAAPEAEGDFHFEGGSHVEDASDLFSCRCARNSGGGLLDCNGGIPARRGSRNGGRFAGNHGRAERRDSSASGAGSVPRRRAGARHRGRGRDAAQTRW